MITKKQYEELSINKLGDLDEVDNLLEKMQINETDEGINNSNRHKIGKRTELGI